MFALLLAELVCVGAGLNTADATGGARMGRVSGGGADSSNPRGGGDPGGGDTWGVGESPKPQSSVSSHPDGSSSPPPAPTAMITFG
mmetsp:Transcript_32379/g.97544  ORF Transcript_32379/g.97544 Transcript_32379/m.97544 type:complete len:86 (-) Transcript_32379:79-336(-)